MTIGKTCLIHHAKSFAWGIVLFEVKLDMWLIRIRRARACDRRCDVIVDLVMIVGPNQNRSNRRMINLFIHDCCNLIAPRFMLQLSFDRIIKS